VLLIRSRNLPAPPSERPRNGRWRSLTSHLRQTRSSALWNACAPSAHPPKR
jgi:hypothetical protein